MRLSRGVIVIVALVLLGAAPCEGVLGDLSTEVVYVNETSHRVVVFPDGRAYPKGQRSLEPGAESRNQILVSSNRQTSVALVEATDELECSNGPQ